MMKKMIYCMLAAAFTITAMLNCISVSLVVSADEVETKVVEHFWYDENGGMISDPDTISMLESAQLIKQRGEVCCSLETMHKVTAYTEEHTYAGTLPAPCVYDKFKIVFCDYCYTVWSRTYVGQYTHTHY